MIATSMLAGLLLATSLFRAEDPRGDDRGPGAYVPPTGNEYRAGDFDLRRFEVRLEKESAILEITLGAAVRRDIVRQRTNAGDLDLSNGIYVQNVDVYVDTTPGQGFTKGLPGRRISFSSAEAWDVAILLTPQPGPTRTVLAYWDREAANKVIFPQPIRSSGPTLTVRVPFWQLGGRPEPTWGWSVVISGAAWDHTFAAVDRLRGAQEANAFTLPVFGVAEERAFGGASLGGAHPWVTDVLLPEGVSQAEVLGRFSAGRYAMVPLIYPQRPKDQRPLDEVTAEAPASQQVSDAGMTDQVSVSPGGLQLLPRPASASLLRYELANVQGDTVVIPSPENALRAWQLGAVFDGQQQVGRLVVTSVAEGFVLATITEGRGRLQVGQTVRFSDPPVRPDAGTR